MFDVIVRGGRVIDPSQELDTIADVAIRGQRIAAIGVDLVKLGVRGEVVDARGAARDARLGRPAHPRLLGRRAAGHRSGPALRPSGRDDGRRCRDRPARPRFPASSAT